MRASVEQNLSPDVKEYISYCPCTGLFHWIKPVTPSSRGRAGAVAGHKVKLGYHAISFRGVTVLAHRLAWFYMTGDFPDQEIDHRNNIKNDNRWENLRLATRSQNCMNRTAFKNNKTGMRGVHQWGNRYIAAIQVNGKRRYLGRFLTAEDAFEAYTKAAKKAHGEFACH